ncbi:RNA polymerase sigma factor [Pyxidicoccus caerfyrddinensis]|uniref:RNA polymerase sigma factor n=1 Tax=Pyxidicoccus caerfyrddinensis TaxID=2709663 RepID=UPI0013DAA0DD|nr:sigma-70 family RNA polymerase sigma factor [Pyxidicoccus caerfyrddinensis]
METEGVVRANTRLWVVKSPSGGEFEAFAWRVQPTLFAILGRYCGGIEHELEDLVHDVLLRALLRWEQLRHLDEDAQRAWTGRVAHNCFLDRCRRKGSESSRMEALLRLHEQSEQFDDTWEPELWEFIGPEDLLQAVERLSSPKLRRTFELFLQGNSYAEIGKDTGEKPGTVGARLTRARRELRELLRETAERRRGERRR